MTLINQFFFTIILFFNSIEFLTFLSRLIATINEIWIDFKWIQGSVKAKKFIVGGSTP